MVRAMVTLLFVVLSLFIPRNITGGNITKQINELETENTEILANVINNLSSIAKSIKLDSLPIHKPLSYMHITSDYGYRKHPIRRRRLFHTGIDLRAAMNTPVMCAADGVVVKVKASRFGYGNYIVIKHAYGYESIYAHLASSAVKIGDNVKLGQYIGRTGSTGLSTGPHLHYEVRLNNKPIDPLFFTYSDKTNRNKLKYINYVNKLTPLKIN